MPDEYRPHQQIRERQHAPEGSGAPGLHFPSDLSERPQTLRGADADDERPRDEHGRFTSLANVFVDDPSADPPEPEGESPEAPGDPHSEEDEQ